MKYAIIFCSDYFTDDPPCMEIKDYKCDAEALKMELFGDDEEGDEGFEHFLSSGQKIQDYCPRGDGMSNMYIFKINDDNTCELIY